ncbi:MAG: deoxynucleoside kinase, partial [Pseudomonadales bacterium]
QKVFDAIIIDAPKPDLVVYLQAPTDVLIERIRKRGIEFEQKINNSYLAQLNDAYMRYFHNYSGSPLLIVNAAEIDFVHDKNQYRNLVETIVNTRSGRHYYNPLTREI